ncbi:hypothetical protein NEAUS04_0602 [Nematocida ausubeli]|uniref:Uncharacterized protein n=1 Tax=Nematocida ausubeli (strain ATCC PRA-371 / ERTm2) TaxID=1913371 RepID=H8ZAW4_NEMA1|nr:uncharacterized protein NESG_01435 [Nematocida ausubeli]EHY66017.1 hypothetical protein NERG_00713 [Nematocida ausubeli]KAI5132551.1 hypothetical protein NEAUS06_0200 [Nematocida ausubeli]KAI5133109.1 hypothetical protein NEAUS07_0402 [Nematocida ausubeli]KAI5147579.1 hypothetical protein NEAUS05_0874 [Nematocida ausubeli]KAI5161598.1 hypothetical protein NEAUS04_0602 [Nematocida ausubeli]
MAKQRDCAHRRKIERTRSDMDIEERKRKQEIQKNRHADTWSKKAEIRDQRRELRAVIQKRDEEAQKVLVANRSARLAARKKKKMLREKYKE